MPRCPAIFHKQFGDLVLLKPKLKRLSRASGSLCVAPHPDDKSLGVGGLLQRVFAQKTPVRSRPKLALSPAHRPDWHVVDKAIDRALEALRADHLTAAECKQTLSELLKRMDT
jgi:hypothetical protein